MKNIIYYFSGTGNSLNVARKISEKLGNTEIISIAKNEKIIDHNNVSRIGIIFPVYAWGPPRKVTDFLKTLSINKNHYIFAIATCGGAPGGTMEQVDKLIKSQGGFLHAGFVVREKAYGYTPDPFPVILMRKLTKKKKSFQNAKSGSERIEEIITIVKNNKKYILEKNTSLPNFLGNLIHSQFSKITKSSDKDFWVDEKCNLCKTCTKICPRQNIDIKNGKHYWKHNCEQCLACIQWCPKSAIQQKDYSLNKPREHNNEIELKDML